MPSQGTTCWDSKTPLQPTDYFEATNVLCLEWLTLFLAYHTLFQSTSPHGKATAVLVCRQVVCLTLGHTQTNDVAIQSRLYAVMSQILQRKTAGLNGGEAIRRIRPYQFISRSNKPACDKIQNPRVAENARRTGKGPVHFLLIPICVFHGHHALTSTAASAAPRNAFSPPCLSITRTRTPIMYST